MSRRATSRGPIRRSSAVPTIVAVACAVALAVLTLLVATGVTQHLDEQVREVFRPGDVWGPAQVRADVVVEGLRPTRVLPAAVLVAAIVAATKRSWRPTVIASGLLGTAIALTLGVKELIERPDPHGAVSGLGGSFPSGHVVALTACSGLVMILLGIGSRWWAWAAVTVAGVAMAFVLLLQAAHWGTDVLGGALLGVGVVTGCLAVERAQVQRDGPAADQHDDGGIRTSADNRRS